MIQVTITCDTMEELFSMLRPQGDNAQSRKAQKTAAADAVINAASDSSQPEQAELPTAPPPKEPKAKAKVAPGPWSDPVEKITVEQLRAAVKAKSDAGHREALKQMLSSLGVPNVTALPQKHYAAFLDQVNAL